jgi:hypothetical protein
MSESNDLRMRRQRMRALEERYGEAQGLDAEEGPADDASDAPDPVGPGRRPGPGGEGWAGEGRRRLILQRVRRFLTRPDGGIDPERVNQLIQFLRRRAQDPSSRGAARAGRVLSMVQGPDGGIDPARIERLLTGDAGPLARGPGLGPAAGSAPRQGSDADRLARIERALQRLEGVTGALLAQQPGGGTDRTSAGGAPDEGAGGSKEGERPIGQPRGRPGNDNWLDDFLEDM